jgi:D-glycero-alpha-D-manno-heptose 1-phosphate guanylyltransferase
MNREAIILAGGMGSRLKTVVTDRPKPMALINNKPFLYYLLSNLKKEGFQHIILAVGFKHKIISNYFGNSFKQMRISYAIEEKPLGTGGGILNALKYAHEKRTFILNGDTFFPVSFDDMEKTINEKNSDLVIALREITDVSRYGTISVNNQNRVVKFTEKIDTKKPGLINGGIYLLNNNSFLELSFPEKFSFEEDFLMANHTQKQFYGIPFNNYFLDIGIPEAYQQAQTDFLNFEDDET